MVTWAGSGVSNISVSRNDVRARRERSRICLVLVPDSLAIWRSFDGESDADEDRDE